MTPKEYLGQLRIMNNDINYDLLKLEDMNKNPIKGAHISSDDGHGGGTSDPVAKMVEKKERLNQQINQKIDNFCDLRSKIESEIKTLEKENYQNVLLYRYRFFMSWKDVSQEMNYDISHIHRLHREALEEFGKVFSESCHSLPRFTTDYHKTK